MTDLERFLQSWFMANKCAGHWKCSLKHEYHRIEDLPHINHTLYFASFYSFFNSFPLMILCLFSWLILCMAGGYLSNFRLSLAILAGSKGVYRGAVPRPIPVPPLPRTQRFHTFQILNKEWRTHKKISLVFIQCTKKIVYLDQSHHDSPKEKSF